MTEFADGSPNLSPVGGVGESRKGAASSRPLPPVPTPPLTATPAPAAVESGVDATRPGALTGADADTASYSVRPKVAALFVETGGVYFGRDDVDPWDIERDARLYAGPYPVVAHPPCNVWCQLASVNHARWGSPIGDDGGLFAFALECVRRWGGVLEHPAYSLAWHAFGLPRPIIGGWATKIGDPGMATQVSQVVYGHPARKRTWLYAVGVVPHHLDWREWPGEVVVGAGINSGQSAGRRMGGNTLATPTAFRDLLIDIASSAIRPAA